MRWDALPCFGNRITDMPAAQRLAAEGAAFSQTFCQMPKCVPSRCSMLTGRYPQADGFRTLRGRREAPPLENGAANDMVALHEDVPNIIPILREKGYRTCLLGKNHVVEWNLHRKWFDATPSWDFDRPPKPETDPALKRASFQGDIPEDFPLERHIDAITADETIQFLESCQGRPFFALVDMSYPHPCYQTIPGMPAASVPLADIPAPRMAPLENRPFVEKAIRTSKDLEGFGDTERKRIRRAYYTMCEFADRQVERILDALDRMELTEDTLVIYTADHGDFAGDYNCFEKWDTALVDPIVRVPLLLRCPGRIPAGWRGDSLVELIDLFPTILEAIGASVPAYAQGASLWPLLRGEEVPWRTEALSGGGVEEALLNLVVPANAPGADPVKQKVLIDCPQTMLRSRMIRTSSHKYIHRISGHHELYDLIADPEEMTNQIDNPAFAPVLADLRARLLERMIEAESTLPEVDKLFA